MKCALTRCNGIATRKTRGVLLCDVHRMEYEGWYGKLRDIEDA